MMRQVQCLTQASIRCCVRFWVADCRSPRPPSPGRAIHVSPPRRSDGYRIDLRGKVAFVAGLADSKGYGFAVAKHLANAGARIIVGAWPPVIPMLERGIRRGFGADSKLLDGSDLKIDKIYPLDATFCTPVEIPEEIKQSRRYAALSEYDIQSCASAVARDYGKIDILVHSLANGPEVSKPLLETSRAGLVFHFLFTCAYLLPLLTPGSSSPLLRADTLPRILKGCACLCLCLLYTRRYLAASSASAFSMVSMVTHFGRIMVGPRSQKYHRIHACGSVFFLRV
jgi:enoyl-[acyl-carrier-protein] reductase (NADH)